MRSFLGTIQYYPGYSPPTWKEILTRGTKPPPPPTTPLGKAKPTKKSRFARTNSPSGKPSFYCFNNLSSLRMCSHCLFPAKIQRWLSVRVVTAYTSCSNNLLSSCKFNVKILLQLNKLTTLLQLVDKLATSLLRTHLVDNIEIFTCVPDK
jgi:hypothetical protein